MAQHQMIEVQATEFASAREAVRHAAVGEAALSRGGQNLVVSRADADRLAALGAVFAYLCDRDGRVVTVPANG